jgi:hypothetical protein
MRRVWRKRKKMKGRMMNTKKAKLMMTVKMSWG